MTRSYSDRFSRWKVLAPGFYARQNIRTPVKIGILNDQSGPFASYGQGRSLRHAAHFFASISWDQGLSLGLVRASTHFPSCQYIY
jgi:hypothetical protein